jgi:hypothetical protein
MAAAAMALGAIPATAGAAMRKTVGKTSQGKQALVWVRDDNSVARVDVRYKAKCRKKGRSVTGRMYWRDRPQGPFQRNGEAFSDGGETRDNEIKLGTQMNGAPDPAGGWTGTFSITATVYNRRGKVRDTCKTGELSWKVGAPA